jgi:choline dehydrogenase-like flavoprotein
LIKSIEAGRVNGRLSSPDVHRLSLLVDFGDVIKSAAQIDEIKRAVKFAAEVGVPEIAIDGDLVAAARPRLSVQGLLNVLSPEHVREVLAFGRAHRVDVRYRYSLDPESAARIVWTGLQTARDQGLNAAKYGLTPLTLSEQRHVVTNAQKWIRGWTAIPAFYVDTPLYTDDDVFLTDRCEEAARLWLDMIAEAGVKIALVDCPDRITPRIDDPSKITPRRLIRDDGGPEDRGVLTLTQIESLIRHADKIGVKILWSGGISAKDAFVLARAGAFGIFTTSSTAKRIAVGPVLAGDLQLAAEFEPSELGVRRIHALLQGGFLERLTAETAPKVAEEIRLRIAVLQSPDTPEQELLQGIENLNELLRNVWQEHWNETRAPQPAAPPASPSTPQNRLEANLREIARDSVDNPLDCIVVGAGSAGLTAVRTLIEQNRGLRVLLLEAGPAPFLTHVSNTELRYSRELSGNLRDQVLYAPKLPDGKPFGPNYGCFGGRGLFWNGAAPRFRDHDFEGWPITAAHLTDDYQWAEREFRVTTSLGQSPLGDRIIEKLNAVRFAAEPGPFAVDLQGEGPGELGAGIASGLGLFFRRCSQALMNDKAGELRVAINSYVERVIHDGTVAKGVVVAADGEALEIFGRSVVLAAGAIESVRLAANSNVPDESKRIGIGIQEHLFYDCWFSAGELYDTATPDTAVVYIPSQSQSTEQWEFHAPGRRLFSLDDGSKWEPSDQQPYWVMCRSFCATEKRDSNRIETLPGGRGEAVVHFDHSEKDEANKVRILAAARRIKQALGLKEADGKPVDSPDRFRPRGASYHEAGGLDMGTDSRTSVTDSLGRFHRLANLLCVDAAAFPRIGATNPHLTIVAVARRKALALAERLQAGTEAEAGPEKTIPVGPQAIRVFCGYRLSTLSRADFFKELGQTFMPGTPLMQAPLGLSAYLPAVTDVEPETNLPEELALIVYSSLDDYNRTRNTSLSRRMYTRSHWAVFDMAKSRAQFPGPITAPVELNQNQITSLAWYMSDRAVDWQFGTTRILFMQRSRSDVSLADSVLAAAREAAERIARAGYDQLIGVATDEFAALWLHASDDGVQPNVAELKIVPAEARLIRDLSTTAAFVRGDDEPGLTIDGASAYTFRFARNPRFFPGSVSS